MEYIIHLLILVCLYLILAQGFNITFGLGRMFNLAHVAAYAVGAYTTALLAVEHGAGFFTCIFASMVLSGLFALFIGLISLRLSNDYFAIGTLAFNAIVSALLINWKSLTRGVLGIPGIPRPELWGIDFYQNTNFLALIGATAAVVYLVLFVVFRSPYARALRGQSEFRPAALAIGKNARFNDNFAFFFSSALAGLAGSFFAYYINYIDPSSFSFSEMVFLLTIVVVGRPGSFFGVAIAAAVLVLLPEPLRFLDLSPSILGPMRQLIHALILFTVVWINRRTLFPLRREV